jgi:hypothetical protein
LFRNPENNDYRMVEGFDGRNSATDIPAHIASAMGLDRNTRPFVGAAP